MVKKSSKQADVMDVNSFPAPVMYAQDGVWSSC
jgi:hypothetical protein